MIEVHTIPASVDAPTEWRSPYGPGSTFRLLLVRVDVQNNAGTVERFVLTLKIDGMEVWRTPSDDILQGDVGTFWFAFDGHVDRSWSDGTEARGIISVPFMPPLTSQRVTLGIASLSGVSMDFAGQVYVDRHDDPRTN